jgi:hypothetical protein
VSEQILIAILGSEPQVVTLTLDLLREKGYSIAAVKVVHTMGESIQAGLKMLDKCHSERSEESAKRSEQQRRISVPSLRSGQVFGCASRRI